MSHEITYTPSNAFTRWLDERLPIMGLAHHMLEYPTPRNLNYWWTFGGILTFCLLTQIVTGIILVMHYTPHVDLAFNSVEHIMRDVNYGWLIRYVHANGASMFFLAVYIHMFRGLYYGSYKAPREVLWILGVIIYLLMMAAAFMGYVLPWGQMSFWGATVITNLFGAIPLVGDAIREWLWGGFAVGNPTLQRFFSLHYLIPFIILGVVVLHIWALHVPGNNNPLGISVKDEQDTVSFHPYMTVKDALGLTVFLLLFAYFVFYNPNVLGHADNYIEADPLQTPPHIVPEWYLLPFYAILRAITFDIGPIDSKLGGVIAMFGSIAILFVLPWLDTSKVRSARFRPLFRQFFFLFVVVCLGLGWAGGQSPDRTIFTSSEVIGTYESAGEADAAIAEAVSQTDATADMFKKHDVIEGGVYGVEVERVDYAFDVAALSLVLTILYFAYFLILLPLLGLIEKTKPLPESISKAVLAEKDA
ncbi:cytochrome b [Tepidicaulis sp.]|jgi:ubiquinol-cytochrome c reductase cytochrome b subunit|uniref:cytochrome b n=1 Tax=Tepidicaulis sp. TaxID=1920809 RepID=UPI003B5BA376